MEKTGSYEIGEVVYECLNTVWYAATNSDRERVVIKVLLVEHPRPSQLARFVQEFEAICSAQNPGVVRYIEQLELKGSPAVVQQEFSGISLEAFLDKKTMPNNTFLHIAIQIVEALAALHVKGVTHRNIRPRTIRIDQVTQDARLDDFGFVCDLTGECEDIYKKSVIETWLPYISPEQTRRVNRPVDYRTDIYSLGIVFYQMLGGTLPFISHDPLEIIHAHIARPLPPLAEKNPSIPRVLARIIEKMVTKNPEGRYQNAYGILEDLRMCRQGLESSGVIGDFPIAQKDIAFKLNIPMVLTGRDAELEQLLATFGKVSEGSKEIVFVEGDPGIGKSAFINELHKNIIEKRGFSLPANSTSCAGMSPSVRSSKPSRASSVRFWGRTSRASPAGKMKLPRHWVATAR